MLGIKKASYVAIDKMVFLVYTIYRKEKLK